MWYSIVTGKRNPNTYKGEFTMYIDFETYTSICELLFVTDSDGFPVYSITEIADMVGVSAEEVTYVDSAESDF
jgi:hypothetical protein